MRAPARTALDFTLRRSPAQLYFRRRSSERLAVLAYHGVDDRESFAAQLDHLIRVANPVSAADLADAIDRRRPLAPRSVLLTFDDGHRSVLDQAWPELRLRGLPGLAFVVAGLVDTESPFWWSEAETLIRAGAGVTGAPAELGDRPDRWVSWLKTVDDADRRAVIAELRRSAGQPPAVTAQLRGDEVRRLDSGGVAVGSHTLTHPCLDRCDSATVHREIDDAHAALTAMIGHPPVAFAYPNGNLDPRAERHLRRLDYRLGFLFDHRLEQSPPTDPLRISRLRVSDTTPLDRFATILSGLHPSMHHARGRL